MDKLSKEDYNNEPVYYCTECMSLRIRNIDGTDYCDKCGSTNIEQTNIREWEHMYAIKYSGNYLNLGN
jgi:hypothetical protein